MRATFYTNMNLDLFSQTVNAVMPHSPFNAERQTERDLLLHLSIPTMQGEEGEDSPGTQAMADRREQEVDAILV